MKIAITTPVKIALAAASIATAGIIALAILDAPIEDRGIPAPFICIEPAAPQPQPQPPPPPEPPSDDVAQPGMTVQL